MYVARDMVHLSTSASRLDHIIQTTKKPEARKPRNPHGALNVPRQSRPNIGEEPLNTKTPQCGVPEKMDNPYHTITSPAYLHSAQEISSQITETNSEKNEVFWLVVNSLSFASLGGCMVKSAIHCLPYPLFYLRRLWAGA
jgi:hypothetical protein